jgi:hypothetical protein
MSDGDAAKLADEIESALGLTIRKRGESGVYIFERAPERDRDLIVTALRSLPREAELRRALVEQCADIAKTMREKHGSPVGDAYSNGVWDQGVRIEQAIRALSSEGQEKKSQSSDGGGKLAPANRRVGSETISPVAGDTKHQGSRIAGVAPGPSEAIALHEGEREAGKIASIIHKHVKSEADANFVDRRYLVGVTEAAAEIASLKATEEDWRDDPAADERWQAGCDYAMMRLCDVLGVPMKDVRWDAATESLDGDVCAVLWNILVAKYGDGFDPSHNFELWAKRWHQTCETIMTILGLSGSGSPEEMLKDVQDFLALRSPLRSVK